MSFDIALSGIQAINEGLDVTSHNIANAGTYGYKSNRANFATLVAGSQLNGVQVGSTTQSIGLSGGILNTGDNLNASISGRGFFATRTANNTMQYTRVGIFDTSLDGYLVDASGRRVQGMAITPPSTELGAQGDLAIPNKSIPAQITTKATYVGNMSADWTVKTGIADPSTITPSTPPDASTYNTTKSTDLYDSLGTKHVLTQYLTMTGLNADGNAVVHVTYALDGNGLAAAGKDLVFDTTNGQLVPDDPPVVADKTVSQISFVGLDTTTTAANWPKFHGGKMNDTVTIDYTGTTFFAGDTSTASNAPVDGYAAGAFSGVQLGADGSVIAKYTNGQSQTVGRLVLATFANEQGLTQVSDTSWEASTASGTANTDVAGVGVNGTLNVATLEQSNVDITSELVGLMTSQRNYQANSKVIQTESTMLQSLMQAI